METAEYEAQAKAFIEKVDTLMHETFPDGAAVVLGLQFGEMGKDESLPPVVLSSNLPICLVGEAIHDMHDMCVLQHDAYHAEEGEHPLMSTSIEDVPPEVREYAENLAETLGIDISQVEFRTEVDTADLTDPEADLPDWLRNSGIQISGPSDIAAAGLGLSDEDAADIQALGYIEDTPESPLYGANTAEAEQEFESGSEQEG